MLPEVAPENIKETEAGFEAALPTSGGNSNEFMTVTAAASKEIDEDSVWNLMLFLLTFLKEKMLENGPFVNKLSTIFLAERVKIRLPIKDKADIKLDPICFLFQLSLVNPAYEEQSDL